MLFNQRVDPWPEITFFAPHPDFGKKLLEPFSFIQAFLFQKSKHRPKQLDFEFLRTFIFKRTMLFLLERSEISYKKKFLSN